MGKMGKMRGVSRIVGPLRRARSSTSTHLQHPLYQPRSFISGHKMSAPATRLIPASSRTLLLTFDAFGTLFQPRLPIPEQYAATAHQFGLSRTTVTPDKLETAFRDTYRAQMRQYPNYGRADVLRGQYGGPRQWWEEVIRGSFRRVLSTENEQTRSEPPKEHVPDAIVEALLDRFAGAEGYALYDDVLPFFRRMRGLKSAHKWSFDRIVVGVISNSDDRVPTVLKSLGLTVGDMRADQDKSSMDLPGFEERSIKQDTAGEHNKDHADRNFELDIDMVITSYEAGQEKPHRLIFDVARRQALKVARPWLTSRTKFSSVHVGDDYKKDYKAAGDAGWESYLLIRDHLGTEYYEAKALPDLLHLADKLERFP